MTREVRASALTVGDTYAEYGMDAVTIAALGSHGDAVLVTDTEGNETTLDADTVVQLDFPDYAGPCPEAGCTLAVTRVGGLAPGGVCPVHGSVRA